MSYETKSVRVRMTCEIEDGQQAAFLACWQDFIGFGGDWQKRIAVKQAEKEQGEKSLRHLIDLVMHKHFSCGSSYTIARILGSLYNGYRIRCRLDDIGGLDADALEHVFHVMRLHFSGGAEIHTYFDGREGLPSGNEVFEKMILDYGLEGRQCDPLGYDHVRELQKLAAAFPVERFTARQAYHAITGAPRQQFPRAEETEGLRQTLLRFQQEGLIESAEGPRGGAGYRLTLLGQCCAPAAEKAA